MSDIDLWFHIHFQFHKVSDKRKEVEQVDNGGHPLSHCTDDVRCVTLETRQQCFSDCLGNVR